LCLYSLAVYIVSIFFPDFIRIPTGY
jgi:hypothetical protein